MLTKLYGLTVFKKSFDDGKEPWARGCVDAGALIDETECGIDTPKWVIGHLRTLFTHWRKSQLLG
jgi:hypothetical protein